MSIERVSERIARDEDIEPAALRAYEKVFAWASASAVTKTRARELADLAGAMVLSTVFGMTDEERGEAYSVEELHRLINSVPHHDTALTAVVIGLQEAMVDFVESNTAGLIGAASLTD